MFGVTVFVLFKSKELFGLRCLIWQLIDGDRCLGADMEMCKSLCSQLFRSQLENKIGVLIMVYLTIKFAGPLSIYEHFPVPGINVTQQQRGQTV